MQSVEGKNEGIFKPIIEKYNSLWKLFIMPHRKTYPRDALGPKRRRLDQENYYLREDQHFINTKGFKVEYTYFKFSKIQEKKSESRITDFLKNFANFGSKGKNENTSKNLCMIYLHSHGGCRTEGIFLQHYCGQLGLDLSLLDFSGSGLSEGTYSTLGIEESQDVLELINCIKHKQGQKKFILWGRSMGAVAAILAASKVPNDIEFMILDSPFLSLERLVRDVAGYYVKLGEYIAMVVFKFIMDSVKERIGHDLKELKPIDFCSQLRIPAIFLVAENDKLVLPKRIEEMFQRYRGLKKLLKVKGNHDSERSSKDINQIFESLSEKFQIKNLKENPENIEARAERFAFDTNGQSPILDKLNELNIDFPGLQENHKKLLKMTNGIKISSIPADATTPKKAKNFNVYDIRGANKMRVNRQENFRRSRNIEQDNSQFQKIFNRKHNRSNVDRNSGSKYQNHKNHNNANDAYIGRNIVKNSMKTLLESREKLFSRSYFENQKNFTNTSNKKNHDFNQNTNFNNTEKPKLNFKKLFTDNEGFFISTDSQNQRNNTIPHSPLNTQNSEKKINFGFQNSTNNGRPKTKESYIQVSDFQKNRLGNYTKNFSSKRSFNQNGSNRTIEQNSRKYSVNEVPRKNNQTRPITPRDRIMGSRNNEYSTEGKKRYSGTLENEASLSYRFRKNENQKKGENFKKVVNSNVYNQNLNFRDENVKKNKFNASQIKRSYSRNDGSQREERYTNPNKRKIFDEDDNSNFHMNKKMIENQYSDFVNISKNQSKIREASRGKRIKKGFLSNMMGYKKSRRGHSQIRPKEKLDLMNTSKERHRPALGLKPKKKKNSKRYTLLKNPKRNQRKKNSDSRLPKKHQNSQKHSHNAERYRRRQKQKIPIGSNPQEFMLTPSLKENKGGRGLIQPIGHNYLNNNRLIFSKDGRVQKNNLVCRDDSKISRKRSIPRRQGYNTERYEN